MDAKHKVFPIQTETACQLKWNWSTIYLNTGITMSCHRTGASKLTSENFYNFHNTEVKLQDRQAMLAGQWPKSSCEYCKDIEATGGTSDRMRHLSIPNLVPAELDSDPTAIKVEPTILEVYFSNACGLACLYCDPSLSSTIDSENKKFGDFNLKGVELTSHPGQYKSLVPYFWEWFPTGFQKLKRFHILGGEPLQQKEFDKFLSMVEQYPNPRCEVNIITNLMVPTEKLEKYIEKLKQLIVDGCVARFELTCSIDCLGPEQEYVRWGMSIDHWIENFEFLLTQKWLKLNINQVISVLTIKTMPALLKLLAKWRTQHKIGHWFTGVAPGPSYMKAEILGPEFINDIKSILSLLPQVDKEDVEAYNYMQGLLNYVSASEVNNNEVQKLLTYLTEKDRRRGTNWQETFPWLKKYVV